MHVTSHMDPDQLDEVERWACLGNQSAEEVRGQGVSERSFPASTGS